MEKILISACLVGDNTRFDGGNCLNQYISELNQYYDLVPFCPEMEGGLPIPREPAELYHEAAKTKDGKDITRFYNAGAQKAVALCSYLGIKIAILKENSPSCGVHHIYNGNFNSTLVVGSGITTNHLKAKGIRVLSEEEIPTFLEACKQRAIKTAAKIEAEKQMDLGKPADSVSEGHELYHSRPFRDGGQDRKRPYGDRKPFRKMDKTSDGFSGEDKFHHSRGDKPYRSFKKDEKGRYPHEDRHFSSSEKAFSKKARYGTGNKSFQSGGYSKKPSYKKYGPRRDVDTKDHRPDKKNEE